MENSLLNRNVELFMIHSENYHIDLDCCSSNSSDSSCEQSHHHVHNHSSLEDNKQNLDTFFKDRQHSNQHSVLSDESKFKQIQ